MLDVMADPVSPRRQGNFKRGFYLHTSWEYAYPFAVRSWQEEDFARFFTLMARLDFNLVMIWPLTEAMPAPLLPEDRRELERMRKRIEVAHDRGLECWLTFCANATARPEIAAKSFRERHLYPYRVDVRLDEPAAKAAYFAHRAELFGVLNNADAYVTIDGDPGNYPGAQPQHFAEVFKHDRAVLDRVGTQPARQQVVPWVWMGWGADWGKHGVWGEPIEPLARPQLAALQDLPEPWTLLPGRHIREGRGNGRTMLALTEEAGLTERAVLLCYEIIEYEPTPPAVVLQFDDIRRVLRQEAPLLAKARGVMGNAQQPILALPNLYFFARATKDTAYLDRDDESILRELADFLGGDPAVLLPAWRCLDLGLEALPADLPERLRQLELRSDNAELLPGGARNYLGILAEFVQTRMTVLEACAARPTDAEQAADSLYEAVRALVRWWRVHRYVFSGEKNTGFEWEFTHPALLSPLQEWITPWPQAADQVFSAVAERLAHADILPTAAATRLMAELPGHQAGV